MKWPTSFNTLRHQELRAVLWRMHAAAGGARTGQKESVRENSYVLNLHGGCILKYPIRKQKSPLGIPERTFN